MADRPIEEIVEHLGRHLPDMGRGGADLTGMGKRIRIRPDGFREIRGTDDPGRIAFVDGGEGILERAPNFTIMINRVYFSLFCGRTRVKCASSQRAEFFSLVSSGGGSYSTAIFPHAGTDPGYLPKESDLASSGGAPDSRIYSQGRSFAEWRMARHVAEKELEKGDIIVRDGSLQTGFKNEAAYTKEFYEAAVSRGVIVCGLSKTSGLVTDAGEPLFAKIAQMGRDIRHSWYVDIADQISRGEKGHVLAVKLHPASRFAYRFEILEEQFGKMSPDDVNRTLASLAANSGDAAMPGYPYGLVDADRFAQVRNSELGMYRREVLSKIMHDRNGKNILRYINANKSHDHLNGVTS